jgi:septal ring factor EnvC (AmiA/AmiB activator)
MADVVVDDKQGILLTTQNEQIMQKATSMEEEYMALLKELEEVRAENQRLQEQIKKTVKAASNAERAAAEAARAHAKMVETLTETMRENNALTIDRDMWKARAQRATAQAETFANANGYAYDIPTSLGTLHVTEDEARAIRKAIARLHHPDSGGNAERMKMWNAALDRIERRP